MDFLVNNGTYFILFILTAITYSSIRMMYMIKDIEEKQKEIQKEVQHTASIDPKLTFGISENIITKYLETFYSINLQHFVDDKTNEILAKEYVEYKTKFIKSFMRIYGESAILGQYISMCFSSTESFITKLSDDFDIHLKTKLQAKE